MISKHLHLDIIMLLLFLLLFSGCMSLIHASENNAAAQNKEIFIQLNPLIIARNEKKISDFIGQLPDKQQINIMTHILDDKKNPLSAAEKIGLVFRLAKKKTDQKAQRELLRLLQNRSYLAAEIPVFYVAGTAEYQSLIPLLVENLTDQTQQKEWAYKALEYAINQDNIGVVRQLLLRLKIDPKKLTQLLWHIVVNNKNPIFIAPLVNNGAAINELKNGITPLIRAVQNNKLEMVKALIQAGAKTNIAPDPSKTPLQIALKNGFVDIELYLRKQAGVSE